MNDAFDFRDIVSFCFVVDSHPCLHLFRFERLRLCWCKVRQLSGGGLRCVFVDTVHSSRLCLKDGTIVSFFVSCLTDDIFVLKYSAYIQTSTSPPPLQWPLVLAFLSTRSCDSCEVGENGMEELVWSTMRRMEWWKRHAFKLREVPPRYSGFQSLFSCQHGKLWFVRGGRGWHGGIGMMNDEKDGMVEKACTVWSTLGQELRLCLEITKIIRTSQNPCANGPTKLLLFSVQA